MEYNINIFVYSVLLRNTNTSAANHLKNVCISNGDNRLEPINPTSPSGARRRIPNPIPNLKQYNKNSKKNISCSERVWV
jgi:hypothetical protein